MEDIITRNDEKNLWFAAEVLVQNTHFSEAKSVIKVIAEKSLLSLNIPTAFCRTLSEIPTNDIPINKQQMKQIQQLKEKLYVFIRDQDEANEKITFIQYIDALSEILDANDKESIRNNLLANALDFSRAGQTSGEGLYVRESVSTTEKVNTQFSSFYSPKEAGEIIGVSDQTIRRMCDNGKFPNATKTAGGHWRIPANHFNISLEEARKRKQKMKGIDEKTIKETGEYIDEFDLY